MISCLGILWKVVLLRPNKTRVNEEQVWGVLVIWVVGLYRVRKNIVEC